MKLLIILVCIALEKYFKIGGLLKRFTWFTFYINAMTRLFARQKTVLSGWIGIVVILLPLLLSTAAIYYLLKDDLFGFLGIILNLALLLYCLGPDDLYHQIRSSLSESSSDESHQLLLEQVPNDVQLNEKTRLNESILVLANERFFGVVFWFILLGPVATVTYRLAVLLRQRAESGEIGTQDFCQQARVLQQLLDWIPARLTALYYLLLGHFQPGFKFWLSHFLTGLSNNSLILQQSGLSALGEKEANQTKSALDLVENALIVILVTIALLTLGAWIV